MGFFDLLDRNVGALSPFTQKGAWPWSGVAEDRAGAEDQMAEMYEVMGFKRPKFAWSLSPRSMNGAMQMLRQVHRDSRYAMVNALVPVVGDGVETETKRVLLHAMLDVNLTVTVGANLRDRFHHKRSSLPLPIRQMKVGFEQGFTPPPNGEPRVAGWTEAALYPMEYIPYGWIPSQALVVAPFLHLCWMSRPPIQLDTDGENLLYAKFADGFELWRKPEEDEEEFGALPSGDMLALPEETS